MNTSSFQVDLLCTLVGYVGRNLSAKNFFGSDLSYNSYLSHQCTFPMLPLFETKFNLTIFFSLNLFSLCLFYCL